MAVLKEDGNIPSESERFMILVIGGSRESMHDFKSFVGITSSEHVAFEEKRIALRTSRELAENQKEEGEHWREEDLDLEPEPESEV